MLLTTFQSNDVIKTLKSTGEYRKTDASPMHFSPVFVVPMLDPHDFLTRLVMTCVSVPQNCIIFESDQAQEISFLKWCKYVCGTDTDVIPDENSYVEYVVPSIQLERVISIHHISDAHPDKLDLFGVSYLQDALLDWQRSDSMRLIIQEHFKATLNLKRFESIDRRTVDRLGNDMMMLLPEYCVEATVKDKDMHRLYSFIKSTMLE